GPDRQAWRAMGRGRRQGPDAVRDAGDAYGRPGRAATEGHGAGEAVAPVGAAGHAGGMEARLSDGRRDAVIRSRGMKGGKELFGLICCVLSSVGLARPAAFSDRTNVAFAVKANSIGKKAYICHGMPIGMHLALVR